MNIRFKVVLIVLGVLIAAFVVILIVRAIHRSQTFKEFQKTDFGTPVLNDPYWEVAFKHDLYSDRYSVPAN